MSWLGARLMIGATAGGPGATALFDINSAAIETALLLSIFRFGMASLALNTAKAGCCSGSGRRWALV